MKQGFLKNSFLIVSIILSLFVLFSSNFFYLQYSIIVGPFIDILLLSFVGTLSFVLAIIILLVTRFRDLKSYIPITILTCSLIIPTVPVGHHIHFFLNKNDLGEIISLGRESNIYHLSDLRRYIKNVNEYQVSNSIKLSNINEIEFYFGSYIRESGLNIASINELRQLLISTDIISFQTKDDINIFIVDGFIDNEYGYIKTQQPLNEGNPVPILGFVIINLIELDDGWYFFYST